MGNVMDCPALKLFYQFTFWADESTWDPWKQQLTPQPCWSLCSWHMSWISSSSEVLISKWTLFALMPSQRHVIFVQKLHCTQINFGCTKMSLDNETTTCSKNFSFFTTDISINSTIHHSNYRPWPSFDELIQYFPS